ncbi:beta-ketoacyl-ACP synthase III [Breznakiella homolactica]|uniref:Beta-ketoacyl-[acyl-carrier-protein] synthase III n=1 Tax=Breznakiella homolactica TaxID=2798577 RepID=A0A7T7XR97_9SPIR|nr:beta-ketoacyl-ACP synthase III [Breznakiella homolactica]QQO11018.1 ketoacyl-ACP synthase III [Breznakiella homolactica]
MAIEIIATGRSIPSKRVTNDDLAAIIDTSDEWIRSHTGIGARHLAEDGLASSDFALEAARNALAAVAERDGVSPEAAAQSLDVIVIGTATPDYYGVPSTACIVQGKLGAVNAAAMDLVAGCTGFIYGLETAAGVLSINKNRKRALVIGVDLLSRITNWDDRSTCVLFGDGAGAAVIEKTDGPSEGPGKRGLLRTILGADGTGTESLIMRRGGSRYPYKAGEVIDIPPHLEMDGRAVYNFAVKAVTGTIEKLMEQEGITMDDVRLIVPHQANARIVHAAGKRLGIPEEKLFLNIEEYANTSAASIPIALDELNRNGTIQRGDLIMTIGFGAGLTYGGNVIIW